jgi:hypothetical protein
MTNETCPFDSAEEKAEWEEMHFSLENEDDAYEKMFGPDAKKLYSIGSVELMRSAFFAGASYGIDESRKIYRGEGND